MLYGLVSGRYILAAGVSCLVTFSSAFGAVHLSLSGSRSDSNAGYQKIESGAVSGGISFDIAEYVRIGYTHRQELSSASGVKHEDKTETEPEKNVKFTSESHVVSHSVDLTLILYAGQVFTPFIFGGVGLKIYDIKTQEGEEPPKRFKGGEPGPNGGAGLSISMAQKLSLTLKHTLSPGVKQLPGEEAERTIDSYSQVGISYQL